MYIIEYGLEAKSPILGLQIVFLAARRDDDYYGGDCRARQNFQFKLYFVVHASNYHYTFCRQHF